MDTKGLGDLQDILSRWQPWLPPKQDQAFNQGGAYVFEGSRVLFSHHDPSTGSHADFQKLLGTSLTMLDKECDTSCELPPPATKA
mmetsp:Transcript_23511/g.60131  ORF Transcript_23511/g.60131 Transcript_23511/m.60131 type:complete len:85 (+) Transcript_23511:513-767(+)